jgi:hypothetical protein
MKPNLLLLAAMVAGLAVARAEEKAETTDQFKSAAELAPWPSKNDLRYWERVLREKPEPSGLQIGKSDYVASGPIIDALRRRKSSPGDSLGRRILRAPIVRLFVPQPMPSPPGGGKYLRWGESDHSWTTVATGRAPGHISNPEVTHEARTSLLSVSLERPPR